MEKRDTLRIAVIGNGPQAGLLGILLQKKGYSVSQFCSIDTQSIELPYYPNDLTGGIMKKFFMDSCISVNYRKKIKSFHLEYADMVFDIPNNFQEFEQYLYEHYSEEGEKLHHFMDDVRIVGNEWLHYIEGGFMNAECMKRSGELFALTLEDAFIRYDISTPSLRELFRLILPKSGVMFNVLSSYLYTQFFDVCALQEDLLNIIASRQTVVSVPSLNALSVSIQIETGDYYDAVIDYRQSGTRSDLDSACAVVMGSFVTHGCKLRIDVEYIVRIPSNKCTIRLWNQSLLQMNGKEDSWKFELIYAEHVKPDTPENSRFWFENFTGVAVEQFIVSSTKTVDMYFDTSHANGYEWAFDKMRSMEDPANLIRKHKENILNPNYWGFAWFSAAYHAANIINNQMQYGNDRYTIQW